MKLRLAFHSVLLTLLVALCPAALASTTWYVDGVNGTDNNDCKSPQTACKTIGHAISLASSGDSVMVAAATYTENLTIGISLKVIGSGANTTIIDGGGAPKSVVTISSANAYVHLSKATIQNGHLIPPDLGGGIFNLGTLTLNDTRVTKNSAEIAAGIWNGGTLAINKSTLSGNTAHSPYVHGPANGGGIFLNNIYGGGILTISNSTLSGNSASSRYGVVGGGAIDASNGGPVTITNSTISGNYALTGGPQGYGGGIYGYNGIVVNNSTISGNSAKYGGGIYGNATLQNSIVANNTKGGNCSGTMTSNGYNLSSDKTCNFNNTGDLNNTDPKLGQLGNYGGPTQTIPLLSGSPAIDAGNPNGCTDGNGHLLKTDQRGYARPDKEDTGGCDMGAYERQSD